MPEHLSQSDLFTFVSPPWEELLENRCLTTLHHTGDLRPLRISLLAYKFLQLTKGRNKATSEISSLWLKIPVQNSSKLHVKQLQEKLGKEVRRLANEHLKILYWANTRERERQHAGDPARARWACGYPSRMQDSLHLSRSWIQPYNEIQYNVNRLYFKRAVPLAAIKLMTPVAALYLLFTLCLSI